MAAGITSDQVPVSPDSRPRSRRYKTDGKAPSSENVRAQYGVQPEVASRTERAFRFQYPHDRVRVAEHPGHLCLCETPCNQYQRDGKQLRRQRALAVGWGIDGPIERFPQRPPRGRRNHLGHRIGQQIVPARRKSFPQLPLQLFQQLAALRRISAFDRLRGKPG